jgi:hypothetical protein
MSGSLNEPMIVSILTECESYFEQETFRFEAFKVVKLIKPSRALSHIKWQRIKDIVTRRLKAGFCDTHCYATATIRTRISVATTERDTDPKNTSQYFRASLYPHYHGLNMGREMVPETSMIFNQLTLLVVYQESCVFRMFPDMAIVVQIER